MGRNTKSIGKCLATRERLVRRTLSNRGDIGYRAQFPFRKTHSLFQITNGSRGEDRWIESVSWRPASQDKLTVDVYACQSKEGHDIFRRFLPQQFKVRQQCLLSLGGDITAELTTIYVKYKYSPDAMSEIFAVVWVKNTTQIVVGLAFPEDKIPSELSPAPARHNYRPLNGYFVLRPGDALPASFPDWARQAYEYRKPAPNASAPL